jgi:hypothetical protein
VATAIPRRWRVVVGVSAVIGVVIWVAIAYAMDGWSGVAGVGIYALAAPLAWIAISNPGRLVGGVADFLLPFAIANLTFLLTPRVVESSEFYKAASGILPTLLLIFVVEKRSDFHSAATSRLQRLAMLTVVGYLAAGGYQVLAVLAVDDPIRGDARLVFVAIVTTLTVLVLSLLTPPPSIDSGYDRSESERSSDSEPHG